MSAWCVLDSPMRLFFGHRIAGSHSLPGGAGDEVAATPAGIAVAVADKLDTLAGIFAIGQRPSGTKDPFGVRRAALGIVRTLIERKLDIDLRALIERAAAQQTVQ